MTKTCNVCGHTGEPFESNGSYYCATCGSELQVSESEMRPSSSSSSSNTTSNHSASTSTSYATCPFCGNSSGNTQKGAIITCGSCRKKFKVNGSTSSSSSTSSNTSSSSTPSYNSNPTRNTSTTNTTRTTTRTTTNTRYNEQLEEKREQLEKKKSESLGLAILFLFIFWPAAIFFFIRWASTSSELKNLK